MKPSLMSVLACPICRGKLHFDGTSSDTDDAPVENGNLICDHCNISYPIDEMIPRMLHDNLPGIGAKRREVAGWVEMAKQQGWYVPNDKIDLVLPFVRQKLGWTDPVWLANEYSFSILLEKHIQPGMRVLEVGAARCWGALHLVPRGCYYVATDILADPNMGLGRGAFYINQVGHFERVQADGEHLPFLNNSFDITYCMASLHHALDMQKMLKEMARVTRPGGLVAALNEGTRPLGKSGDAQVQETEKQFGINEHVHPLHAYWWGFLRAGLMIRQMEHADGYEGLAQHPKAGRLLRLPRGKIWSTLYTHNFLDYFGVSLFATKLGLPHRSIGAL